MFVMGFEYVLKTSMREVDCTPYRIIVEHPYVKRLKNAEQTSMVKLEYLGSTHTRLDHTGMVHHFTNEITGHLRRKGCIDSRERENLKISALLHDTGHPPYSHAAEFVLEALENSIDIKYNHKVRAVELIESNKKDRKGRTLKQCIEGCGGDVEVIEKIILKQHPLSPVISHKTLGADVTAYTLQDSNRTNFTRPEMSFYLDLFRKYYFDGETLGLEDGEKIPHVKSNQTFYQDMYTDVYFHARVRYFVRQFEKALQIAIENDMISQKKVWSIEQFELDHLLNKNPKTKCLFRKIQNEEMGEQVFSMGYETGKEEEMRRVAEFCSNPLNNSKIEREIAAKTGCKPDQISCVLTVIPHYIIPEDVYIFSLGQSIFERSPSHYQSLVDNAKLYTRVGIFRDSPKIKLDERICEEILLEKALKEK
jgi:hypothetical protein